MSDLPGTPRVGNRHGQHDAVLAPTPLEPIQGDPG